MNSETVTHLPLVSVHIICYNQEHLIGETIESALDQEYENIEIVVADDGSTDATPSVVESYAKKYPGRVVSILGHQNVGITRNSNRGLAKCKGEYIAFLGGDDLMMKGKIKRQIEHFRSDPDLVMSYHNMEVFESGTNNILRIIRKPYYGGATGFIRRGVVNAASATMVRRDCLPKVGFDTSFPVASDWFLSCSVLMNTGRKIGHIDEVLGRYRRHETNVTGRQSPHFEQGLRDHLNSCLAIVLDHPRYSRQAQHRMGAILRGLRHRGEYGLRLRASLRASFQAKTLLLYIAFMVSFGKLRL